MGSISGPGFDTGGSSRKGEQDAIFFDRETERVPKGMEEQAQSGVVQRAWSLFFLRRNRGSTDSSCGQEREGRSQGMVVEEAETRRRAGEVHCSVFGLPCEKTRR